MIPADWSDATIGDVCELINGRGFKPHEWKKAGLPIIRIQNLNGSGDYNYYDGSYDPKIEIHTGQLLFAWSGSRGASFGPHIWRGPKAVLNYHTWKVEPRPGQNGRFLYHLLKYLTVKIEGTAHGAASLVHTQKGEMESYPFSLPTNPEQRRIAAVLDAWDDAIATAEKLVAAKDRRLTWLADQLAFQAVEWLTIEDVAEQVSNRAGSGFKSFDVFSCTKHDGLVLSDAYFTKTVYGADRTDYKIVDPNQLAYATNHIEEGSIGLNTQGKPGIVSPMYTVFKATGIDPHFLIAVLKTERMRREFERRTPASVNRRGGLRWGDFAEIEIPCPSEDEQARVLSMLNCARTDFKAAEDHLTLLRQQKRGMMQKLLTGQWRVPEGIDALLPEAVPA